MFQTALWGEILCSCTQTILTILIYFSHTNIFKAVHESHINRSKFGNSLIREIVTVFVTHTCIFVFFPIRYSPFLNAQINKITEAKEKKKRKKKEKKKREKKEEEVNLMYFGNAKVIHQLIHV